MSERLPLAVVLAPSRAPELRGRARVASRSREARAALEQAARRAGCALPAGALAVDERGAPLPLRGARGEPLHWSLTHGGALVAALCAQVPVGLDLEGVRLPRAEIVAATASAAELALCAEAEPASGLCREALAFARAWTAKEAVLKRAGCGLGELSRTRVLARPAPELLLVAHRGATLAVRSVLHASEGRVHVLALAVAEEELARGARFVVHAAAPATAEVGA